MAEKKYVALDAIRLNPENPRLIKDGKFKLLVNNVARFTKMLAIRGIVVDAQKMILGGNKRWEAILHIVGLPQDKLIDLLSEHKAELKIWNDVRSHRAVPAEWIIDGSQMSPDEIEQFIIIDNVPFGEWDWDVLKENWDLSALAEWGLDVPDFTPPTTDVSNDYVKQFKVEITVSDESEQEQLFNEFTERGYECKVLTL